MRNVVYVEIIIVDGNCGVIGNVGKEGLLVCDGIEKVCRPEGGRRTNVN